MVSLSVSPNDSLKSAHLGTSLCPSYVSFQIDDFWCARNDWLAFRPIRERKISINLKTCLNLSIEYIYFRNIFLCKFHIWRNTLFDLDLNLVFGRCIYYHSCCWKNIWFMDLRTKIGRSFDFQVLWRAEFDGRVRRSNPGRWTVHRKIIFQDRR